MNRGSVSPLDPLQSGNSDDQVGDAAEGNEKRVSEEEEKAMWEAAFGEEEEEVKWREAFGDGSKEGLKAKFIRRGYNPTLREIEEHMTLHLPYRAWCIHCVKGKCKGSPHRQRDSEEKEEEQVPLVSVDYMFMHDKQKEKE